MTTEAIRGLLARWREAGEEEEAPRFQQEAVAAAALMVECARIDGEFSDEERDSICNIVRDRCGLDAEMSESLVSVAEKRNDEVWHNFLFTEQIRTNASPEQQRRVIERLWEVAFADGTIHHFEAHLIERIGRELGISDEIIQQRREAVRERLGIEESEG
jgi:uncharacterized tellurite resistance protein B-like protein